MVFHSISDVRVLKLRFTFLRSIYIFVCMYVSLNVYSVTKVIQVSESFFFSSPPPHPIEASWRKKEQIL